MDKKVSRGYKRDFFFNFLIGIAPNGNANGEARYGRSFHHHDWKWHRSRSAESRAYSAQEEKPTTAQEGKAHSGKWSVVIPARVRGFSLENTKGRLLFVTCGGGRGEGGGSLMNLVVSQQKFFLIPLRLFSTLIIDPLSVLLEIHLIPKNPTPPSSLPLYRWKYNGWFLSYNVMQHEKKSLSKRKLPAASVKVYFTYAEHVLNSFWACFRCVLNICVTAVGRMWSPVSTCIERLLSSCQTRVRCARQINDFQCTVQ